MFRDIVYCIKFSWKASKLYTILLVITEIFRAFLPFFVSVDIKFIIDSLSDKRLNIYGLVILLILYMVQNLVDQMSQYVYSMQSESINRYLQWDLMKTSANMKMEFYDNHEYYNAYECVKNDLYVIWLGIVDSVTIISYGVLLINAVSFIVPYLKCITFILILVSLPSAISEYYFTEKLYEWRVNHVEEERKMDYFYNVCTQKKYAPDIRLYGLGESFLNKAKLTWKSFVFNKRKVIKERVAINYLFEIVEVLVSIYALYKVILLIIGDIYTIGDFTLYVALLEQMRNALQSTISGYMDLYDKKLKIDYYINFKKNVVSERKLGNRKLKEINRVELRNVSFKYPKMDNYVLKNVSFSINKGEKICIVGENGAGKSTIIKLLLGFYEPTVGDIYINGLNMWEYDINMVRDKFCCFFQNDDLFAFTVKDNITLYESEVENDRIDKSINKINAATFIDKLPKKMNTYISREFSENGVELSGGQIQKILLSRVFFRDADIWLLDEPSAALDPKTENILFNSLQSVNNKAILFISHRLSNVYMADRIIVLNDGCIEACGTHSELLLNCENYRTLFNYQAEKYTKGMDG